MERNGYVTQPFTATSERDLRAVTGTLKFAKSLRSGKRYVKPTVGLGFTHLKVGSATESGAGALQLSASRAC